MYFSNQILNINNILDNNDNGNVNTNRKLNPQILRETKNKAGIIKLNV